MDQKKLEITTKSSQNMITIECGGSNKLFKIENNEQNKSILLTSNTIKNMLGDCNESINLPIPLPYIQDQQSFTTIWKHMELIHGIQASHRTTLEQATDHRTILKQTKEFDKKKLITLINYSDFLDINHNKISLLDLYCSTLGKKLDIQTDKQIIIELSLGIQEKLTSSLLEKIEKHSNKIIGLSSICDQALSLLGNFITTQNDRNVTVHDIKKTGETIHNLTCAGSSSKCASPISLVAITPDGKKGFTSHRTGNIIHMWDLESGERLFFFELTSSPAVLCCDNNNTQLLCIDQNETLYLWDINTCRLIQAHKDEYLKGIQCAAFSKKGDLIITGSHFNIASIYHMAQGGKFKHLKSFDCNNCIRSVAFSHDGSQAIIGSYPKMFLWNFKTGECTNDIALENNSIPTSVALSKNGNYAYVVLNGTNSIVVFDLKNKIELSAINVDRKRTNDGIKIPVGLSSLKKALDTIKIEENGEFKTQQSLSLYYALWLSHIYQNYTKKDELYYVEENGPVDKILNSIDQKLGALLKQCLFFRFRTY